MRSVTARTSPSFWCRRCSSSRSCLACGWCRLRWWPIAMPAVWVLGESVRSIGCRSPVSHGVDLPTRRWTRPWTDTSAGRIAGDDVVSLLVAGLLVVRRPSPRRAGDDVVERRGGSAGARGPAAAGLAGPPRRRRSRWCRAMFREILHVEAWRHRQAAARRDGEADQADQRRRSAPAGPRAVAGELHGCRPVSHDPSGAAQMERLSAANLAHPSWSAACSTVRP